MATRHLLAARKLYNRVRRLTLIFRAPNVVTVSSRGLILLALAVGLLNQVGCNNGRKTYQVAGHARYKDGSPITGGVRAIRLEPTESSTAEIRKSASGDIAPDGSFTMFTRKPGDGVIPGEYAVTFTVLDKPMGGKSLILSKYGSPTDTPFEISVDGDKTDLIFELEKE